MKGIFCTVLAALLLIPAIVCATDSPLLTIHYLDVGQADAAIILCGDEVLMIDGGNSSNSSFVYSYLTNTLGIKHIDYMIATHPHEDHIGGLSAALNACSVGTVYSPVLEYDSKQFSSLVKYTTKQGVEITIPTVGDVFTVGEAMVQFLSPMKQYESTNDLSIIVRISYDETTFLFTGDAEWESENDLVNSNFDISSTVLKLGHHGSDSSTSYAFLQKVKPQYAIISVGADNSYGHPSEMVIGCLEDAGVLIYRTDLHGTIICESDGKNLTFLLNANDK